MFPVRDSVVTTHPPLAVAAIILVNVLAFFYELGLGEEESLAFLTRYALVPARYFDPAWGQAHSLNPHNILPFLTNAFVHGGWLHILSNMWVLYILGPALEDRLGLARFLALYLLSAIAASLAYAGMNAGSMTPVLGASGAVAGIIAAYAMRFPRAWVTLVVPIFVFPFFFNVPVVLFAGVWFLMQVLMGVSELITPGFGGTIAWWAHAGGFVAGALLLHLLEPRHAPVPIHRSRYPGEGPWSRNGPSGD